MPTRRWMRALLVAAAVSAGLAVGAFAYWTGTGSGTGTEVLDNPLALTLSPGTASDRITPGDVAFVTVVVSNPNPYRVSIGSFALDTSAGTNGFGVDGAHSGCSLSALSFATDNNGGAGWSVPAEVGSTNGSAVIELDDALSMSTGAANACQGAAFTVHLIATS